MNFSNRTGETNVDSTWYTCKYMNYSQGKSSCWELDKCKPMIVFLQSLAMFGFISNVAVFFLICAEKRLHKPIYTGIRMLCIPDASFLLYNFLVNIFLGMEGLLIAVVYLYLASFYASIGHVILLSVQQYLLIAYPLQCLTWIRSRRLLVASAIIWMLALLVTFPYIYLTFLTRNKKAAALLNIVYIVLLTFGPICVLGILHIMKIIALKKSLVNNSDKTTKKVSQVISVVVGVFVVTTMPINIRDIIEMSVCPMIDTWYIILGHIGRTLLIVNHSINPYIYFISTPQFRRVICKCFGYKVDMHSGYRSNTHTESAQISSIRSQTSSVKSEPSSGSPQSSTRNNSVSTRL